MSINKSIFTDLKYFFFFSPCGHRFELIFFFLFLFNFGEKYWELISINKLDKSTLFPTSRIYPFFKKKGVYLSPPPAWAVDWLLNPNHQTASTTNSILPRVSPKRAVTFACPIIVKSSRHRHVSVAAVVTWVDRSITLTARSYFTPAPNRPMAVKVTEYSNGAKEEEAIRTKRDSQGPKNDSLSLSLSKFFSL